MKTFVKHIVFFFLLTICYSSAIAAVVKDITVSYDKSYTDHLSISEDNREMDLMVKFVFNEDKNTLTVSLLSYRHLFVFRDDSRYKNIIHHNRLVPDDLPYIAEFPEKSRFLLSKQFRKSIPKPQKDYIFKRWINYQGLQPVPADYKMVNDYIDQTFDIINYGNNVSVELGYVIVMEKTPTKKHPDDFTFLAGRNLDIVYHIHIERNPCFGLESELELASNNLDAVSKAYQNFSSLYQSREVDSESLLKNFNDMKQVLLTQFQFKKSESACQDLKSVWDKYDSYVDSISKLNCVLKVKNKEPEESGGGNSNFDPTELTTLARQIDKNVSRWLMSNDVIEKQDLVKECEDIISEVNSTIGKSQGSTPQQKKAVNVFRQAEFYFRKTCVKKNKL